jgi:hypothetical protein
VAGYPGDFVVLARRSGTTWYLAGINGKAEAKSITVKLPFLPSVKQLDCIVDGPDLNSFGYEAIAKDSHHNFTLKLQPNGGFVAVIKK